MRKYIRHPSDIPIEFRIEGNEAESSESLHDVSYGGLAFSAEARIPVGTRITISVRFVNPPFTTSAVVRWCRKRGDHYDVGVAFVAPDDAYRARMIEQVCHIEHYKREALAKEGRRLSGAQAAAEWIRRFAATFPTVGVQD